MSGITVFIPERGKIVRRSKTQRERINLMEYSGIYLRKLYPPVAASRLVRT